MATTYGQRLIAAVVPRFWKDLTALQRASGRAYSTIHDWSSGKANPRLEQLDELVKLIEKDHGVVLDPLDLIGPVVSADPVVVPDDRYPSRAEVLVALRAFTSDEARARVASQANFGAGDPGALYWIEALVRAQKDLDLERTLGGSEDAGAKAFAAFANKDAARAEKAREQMAAAVEKKRRG